METSITGNTGIADDEPLRQRIDVLARERGISPSEIVWQALEHLPSDRTAHGGRDSSNFILELVERAREGVPRDAWKTLPPDLARNFDHYHYGHPREE
jgi:hypothetical protein